MPKFFTEKNNINLDDKKIFLDEETSHHVIKVLRYKTGDKLEATCGDMIDYDCIISSIENNKVILDIIGEKENNSEFPFEVNLYQGIAKGDKMDNIIQKSTELGITNIIPTETKFTVVKLSDEKSDKKIDRWNKIAKEAAKQSERGMMPLVKSPMTFKKAIDECIENESLTMVCYGREDHYNLKNFFNDNNVNKDNIKNIKSISFFIGPEGGFSTEEIDYAKEKGATIVSLGDRILRTETASIAMLSMLCYELF
ncbi:MAG: 16S rRNA (uracil(1498)-N(3))-methyltransferase [Clostridia bacterium]|nr:16S rRNA (uracil(1498)-N(3))-methyltransferase [Clostridia bacterium]